MSGPGRIKDADALLDKIKQLQQADASTHSPLMRRLALLHVLQAIGETYYAAHSGADSGADSGAAQVVGLRQILSHLSLAAMTRVFTQEDHQQNQAGVWASAWAGLDELAQQIDTGSEGDLPEGLDNLSHYLRQQHRAPSCHAITLEVAEKRLLSTLVLTPSPHLKTFRDHRNAFYRDRTEKSKTVAALWCYVSGRMGITQDKVERFYNQDKHLVQVRKLAETLVKPGVMKSDCKAALDKAINCYNNSVEALFGANNRFALQADKVYCLHYALHRQGHIKTLQKRLSSLVNGTRHLFAVVNTASEEIDDGAYTDIARTKRAEILKRAKDDCQHLANTHTTTRKKFENDLKQDPLCCFAARFAIGCVWEAMNSLVEYPQYSQLRMRKVRNYLFHGGVNGKRNRLLQMERTTTYLNNNPRLVAQQLYIVTINLAYMLTIRADDVNQQGTVEGALLQLFRR